MGHKTNDWVLKSKLNYAVLNKETNKITIYQFQKDIADLFGVSRRTIYRSLPYENNKYIVYEVANVPR